MRNSDSSKTGTKTANITDMPPFNNMGGTEIEERIEQIDITEEYIDGTEIVKFETKGGKAHLVRIPKKDESVNSRAAFIDQVSFTIKIDAILRDMALNNTFGLAHEIELLPRLNNILANIFGYELTKENPKGLMSYKKTYELGSHCGVVCTDGTGGASTTVHVALWGQGAMTAESNGVNWTQNLYDYLTSLPSGSCWLTRADAAADFFEGQYTPIQADKDYDDGKFSLTNNWPDYRALGDWKRKKKKGLTFEVGKRANGKLFRCYEKKHELVKAKEVIDNPMLKDLEKWTRVEVEWRNKDRVIPFDILIEPGKYLAASYPALGFISKIQERIRTIKNVIACKLQNSLDNFIIQAAPTALALGAIFGKEALWRAMEQNVTKMPGWVKRLGYKSHNFDDFADQWHSNPANCQIYSPVPF